MKRLLYCCFWELEDSSIPGCSKRKERLTTRHAWKAALFVVQKTVRKVQEDPSLLQMGPSCLHIQIIFQVDVRSLGYILWEQPRTYFSRGISSTPTEECWKRGNGHYELSFWYLKLPGAPHQALWDGHLVSCMDIVFHPGPDGLIIYLIWPWWSAYLSSYLNCWWAPSDFLDNHTPSLRHNTLSRQNSVCLI